MLTPSQWYHNALPIRVVRMRGRSDWLPREQTFCSYVKRFQIMRANCRLSEVRTLFFQVLHDHFDGDTAALARALEELRQTTKHSRIEIRP